MILTLTLSGNGSSDPVSTTSEDSRPLFVCNVGSDSAPQFIITESDEKYQSVLSCKPLDNFGNWILAPTQGGASVGESLADSDPHTFLFQGRVVEEPMRVSQQQEFLLHGGMKLTVGLELPDLIVGGEQTEKVPLQEGVRYFIGRHTGESAASDAEKSVKIGLDPALKAISRNHVEIAFNERAGWLAQNLKTRGATLNAKNFKDAVLVHGDRVEIGVYVFEFRNDPSPELVRIDHQDFGAVDCTGLVYEVKHRDTGEAFRILDDVHTNIRSGEFIGILGGSGQGKSTLLNALSGLVPAPKGESRIAGVRSDVLSQKVPGMIGFVPQDDIVHRDLTVNEAMRYSGRLRLRLPKDQLKKLIDRMLEALGLTEHRSKTISQLSGGQRKRVSIGIELLSKPAVIFLDEPSSGLDPSTEADLMELLQSLSKTNLTVVCTTHVLQKCYLFSRIFFVHNAKLIFEGHYTQAPGFFLKQEGVAPSTDESDERVKIEDIQRIYPVVLKGERSGADWEKLFRQTGLSAARTSESERKAAKEKLKAIPKVKTPNVLSQFLTLLARQWRLLCSDFRNIMFLVAQSILIGLIIGGVSDEEGLRMFLGLIAAMWFGCSNGAQQIVGELPIFKRENLCGLGFHTYISSKMAFQAVVTVVQAVVLFTVITATSALVHPHKLTEDFENELRLREGSMLPLLETPASAATATADEEDDWMPMGSDEVEEMRARGQSDQDFSAAEDLLFPEREATVQRVDTMRWLAKTFRIEENLLKSARTYVTDINGEVVFDADGKPLTTPVMGLWLVAANCLGLKFGSFVLASLVGVAMGLTVSAWVRTETQAVMWVPLLLIPQILLGGYVITVAELPDRVRPAAAFVPSFSAQKLIDVSHVFGRTVPSMSNKTETPTFMRYGDFGDWIYWTEGNEEKKERFYETSEINVSWQNLSIDWNKIGEHKKAESKKGRDAISVEDETVDRRRDVNLFKGTMFLSLKPAYSAIAVLFGWIVFCYLAIWRGLARQRGL